MEQIHNTKQKLDECIAYFKNDIATLRTGRATPALVEHITVEAYGARTPLVHMASITAPDPRTIIIQPWDKALLKEVEKGIATSDLNIMPIIDGVLIRISLPQLTEENRKNLVKLLHQKAEACKVTLRQQREKTKSDIAKAEEEGSLSEDQKFKGQKQLDDMIKDYNDMVHAVAAEKEKEIMTI